VRALRLADEADAPLQAVPSMREVRAPAGCGWH